MLELNVGLSRKVGKDNDGSRAASLNLEVALDSGAAGQLDRPRDQTLHRYALARESVAEELKGGAEEPSLSDGQRSSHPANGDARSHWIGQWGSWLCTPGDRKPGEGDLRPRQAEPDGLNNPATRLLSSDAAPGNVAGRRQRPDRPTQEFELVNEITLSMNARKKLNSTYFLTAVLVAAVIGGMAHSWTVFFLTLALLAACSYYNDDIRLRSRRR